MTQWKRIWILMFSVALVALAANAALAGGDWNDTDIKWMAHDEGLALARETGTPICVVIYTDWCPHCTNYAKLFHETAVVEASKDFVMVRLNKTRQPKTSALYAPDGEYIPRTYFLSPKGELDASIHAPRKNYLYFYNESKSTSLLGGMAEALKKLKP